MNKDINTSVRNKELRFYKEDGEWYADVAEHTQAKIVWWLERMR